MNCKNILTSGPDDVNIRILLRIDFIPPFTGRGKPVNSAILELPQKYDYYHS